MLVKLYKGMQGEICEAKFSCPTLEVPKTRAKTSNRNFAFKVSTSKLNIPL